MFRPLGVRQFGFNATPTFANCLRIPSLDGIIMAPSVLEVIRKVPDIATILANTENVDYYIKGKLCRQCSYAQLRTLVAQIEQIRGSVCS